MKVKLILAEEFLSMYLVVYLSKGHPLGATGIANIYEVCTHLRGEAGERQVENAKIGMTHVIGLEVLAVYIYLRKFSHQNVSWCC